MTGWHIFLLTLAALVPYALMVLLAALLAWGLWRVWRHLGEPWEPEE